MEIGLYTHEELVNKCQENSWLKINSPVFLMESLSERDYPYSFTECLNPEELLEKIGEGNWPIRKGFIYNSLAFINQVNGGDEWWALKKLPDDSIHRFESLSFGPKIRAGKDWGGRQLADVIRDLDAAKSLNELEAVWRLPGASLENIQMSQDEWEQEL